VASASLFVYGTLMSEARLYSLTGRRFPRRRARLDGFARILPRGGHPYIVPRLGAHVVGVLLEGVDADSLGRLDAYEDEGRLYHRRPVEVMAAGRRVACETYVGDVATLRARVGPDVGGDRRGPLSRRGGRAPR
jgi:gamma-glutamylcyclotransferase (GGCT)/AIG2-like uncharacterized protein YtfP